MSTSSPVGRAAVPERVEVDGLRVHPVTREDLLSVLASWLRRDRCSRRLYYTNAHVFNLAARDEWFRDALNSADLLICEGWGGMLGSRIVGRPLPQQLATMDWMDEYLERAAQVGASLFLLGDEPGVASACASEMARRHPGLRIAGVRHGFWDREGPENREVLQQVRAADPDILMVGLGNPIQERWIETHLADLEAPVVMALGAMFRWYSGVERRAPSWMRAMHLEWLMRLAKHPVRHFRRYVIGNPWFVLRCLRQRLRREG